LIKYTVEMGSGAMVCIPSFIKIGSGIRDHLSLLSFFHNKESRLKTEI
jgi:hypothetical protein